MNIRKTALALGGALMLFATTLKAQEQPMSFGIKAGASISWLQGMGDKTFNAAKGDSSFRLFPAGGLTFGYAFTDMIGVGFEALYAGLGGVAVEKKVAGATDSQQYKIYTHNVVLPLMVKIFPMGCDPEEGILDFHVGGEAVLALAADAESSTDGKKFTKDAAFKKDEHINMFTASVIGGLGYELPEMGLTFEARYSYGLMDVLKGKDDTKGKAYRDAAKLGDHTKFANQYATVSVGYNLARLLED